MPNPQWIIVDDTDPAIVYNGVWAATNGMSYNEKGNFGKTYNNTLHGVSTTGGLSFAFQGSGGRLLGTTDISNSSGVIDPTWECFVDQTSIGSTTPFAYTENNWVLCEWANLTDSKHLVSLTVSSNGQTFWVDQIQYLPSADVDLNDATILVDRTDPAISIDTSWVPLGDIGYMTQTPGATARYKFSGSRLAWVGTIPTELPHQSTNATYSIDGQSPVRFALPGLSGGDTATQFNYIFFQTDYLAQGPHELLVTHDGDSSSTPLVLGSLIVENDPALKPGHNLVGAIVGGILGGLALVLAAIAAIVYMRRRYGNQPYKAVLLEEPFHYIRPFTLTRPSESHEQTSSYTSTAPSSNSAHITPYPFISPTATSTSQPPPAGPTNSPAPASWAARKRAEIAAAAAAAARMDPQSTENISSESDSRVLVHQDSGLRLSEVMPTETTDVIEVPPHYTTG